MIRKFMSQDTATKNRNAVIDLNDLLHKMIFHWPLYLLTIAIAVGGALLYLKYKKPMYMSDAKLYLKDEKKGPSEEMDALKSLSLFNNSKNMENEMEVIKSPILLQQVLGKNNLNIRYYIKGPVQNQEVYNHAPLTIQVLGNNLQVGNYLFDVTPENGLLAVKQVHDHNGGDTQFTVKPGEAFTVGKDKFSIASSGPLPAGTIRIRVDSVMELANDKIEDIGTALVNRDATVVEVSYKDPVPERAAFFLNALLDEYNDYTLDDKNRGSLKTIQFLGVRIDSLREELGLLEKQEENFKVQRGITDIDASSKLALEQVKEADLQLNEANLQLSVFDQVEDYVNDPSSNYPFAPVGNVDQTLTAMINRYEEALKEKARLSLTLKPTSVMLQNLEAQITDTRKTIKDYIAGYRRNAGVVQKQTQEKVNQIQGKIANIPTYAREYINIKRQQGVKESLYLYLLKKKEEAAVAYASNVVDNKIIAPAFVPEKPISPNKTLAFVGFIGAGLVLASSYVYLKYFLNPRVLNKKEIEAVFDLPVIAEIYQQEAKGTGDLSLKNGSLLVEQLFSMRTNLKFLLTAQTGPTTILLTSSISGEGKTFLSAHLGNALTVSNKKVVLVELDLRKPKLSRFLGFDHNNGVTDYIIGNKTVDEIIKKVPGSEGLYLVSAGPIPPNPIELIEGPRMASLLDKLKAQFDYVIIDTSPIGIVSDAKSLAAQVDCALFVVRYNFTLKSKLLPVSESVKKGVFKKIGIVFNGIEQHTFYPYYYYDHYAYGENKKNNVTWLSLVKKMKQRIA